MPEFTPERWTYEPCGDVDGDRIGTDHFVLDHKGDEVACPGSEARARLIAASPELFEASERLIQLVEFTRIDESRLFLDSPHWLAVEKAIRNAIASVKGPGPTD